jgi:hypothetical protein
MKIKKTTTVIHHLTDSELKSAFCGIGQVIPIWQLFALMRSPLGSTSTLNIDNTAVGPIITADNMKPRY